MNNHWPHFLKISGIVFVLALAFGLAHLVQEVSFIKNIVIQYGYLAIFAIALVSSLNLVIPIPAVVFLPVFLEAGFNLWAVIFIVIIGMLLADSLAFFIGKAGRQIILTLPEQKILHRLEKLKMKNEKLPYLFLFLFATFAPFPNEVILIPLGLMDYKYKNILIPLALGNLVFNILYAFGAINIFNFLYGL
jgi:membrane protein DedA with SNARE-associated domain